MLTYLVTITVQHIIISRLTPGRKHIGTWKKCLEDWKMMILVDIVIVIWCLWNPCLLMFSVKPMYRTIGIYCIHSCWIYPVFNEQKGPPSSSSPGWTSWSRNAPKCPRRTGWPRESWAIIFSREKNNLKLDWFSSFLVGDVPTIVVNIYS